MAKRLDVFVEKGKDNRFGCSFDGCVEDCSWNGSGTTAAKAMMDMKAAEETIREYKSECGVTLPEVEYSFRFDIGSFFDYYYYLSVSGVAKRLGINPGLMRKYASGVTVPSEKRQREIEAGLNEIASEIAGTRLWAFRETAADRRRERQFLEMTK